MRSAQVLVMNGRLKLTGIYGGSGRLGAGRRETEAHYAEMLR